MLSASGLRWLVLKSWKKPNSFCFLTRSVWMLCMCLLFVLITAHRCWRWCTWCELTFTHLVIHCNSCETISSIRFCNQTSGLTCLYSFCAFSYEFHFWNATFINLIFPWLLSWLADSIVQVPCVNQVCIYCT